MRRFNILIFILLLSPLQLYAEPLPLPTFTSPEQKVEKSEQWNNKPIVYADGVQADIVLSLDQQLHDSLIPLIRAYGKDHQLNITISKGTCGISAGNLARKRVDIAGFCCPPGNKDRLPGIQWHTLGITPLVLIVHPQNGTKNISLQQARDVYSGNSYKWEQVSDSGYKGMIHPIGRLHCKHRPGHWRLMLNHEDDFSPDLMEVGAIPDMIRSVAVDKYAIGYESPWMIKSYQQDGAVRWLNINGISPHELGTKNYPLYRTYNITSWSDKQLKNPHADKLISYLLEEVEHINPDFHLVPASTLKKLGWSFIGDELVGEPEQWR